MASKYRALGAGAAAVAIAYSYAVRYVNDVFPQLDNSFTLTLEYGVPLTIVGLGLIWVIHRRTNAKKTRNETDSRSPED